MLASKPTPLFVATSNDCNLIFMGRRLFSVEIVPTEPAGLQCTPSQPGIGTVTPTELLTRSGSPRFPGRQGRDSSLDVGRRDGQTTFLVEIRRR